MLAEMQRQEEEEERRSVEQQTREEEEGEECRGGQAEEEVAAATLAEAAGGKACESDGGRVNAEGGAVGESSAATRDAETACMLELQVEVQGLGADEELYVCGGHAVVGEWDSRRALPLLRQGLQEQGQGQEAAGAGGRWVGRLLLPAHGYELKYKYIAGYSGKGRWETGPDRSFLTPPQSVTPPAPPPPSSSSSSVASLFPLSHSSSPFPLSHSPLACWGGVTLWGGGRQ